jgi:glycosyltransferase involved in cell wall biosynthesis
MPTSYHYEEIASLCKRTMNCKKLSDNKFEVSDFMIIYYLHHYATPPSSGGVGRPHSLAKELAHLGHRVIVVCAADHHLRSVPAAIETLNCIAIEDGVEYFALSVRPYKDNGVRRLQNILDYCSGIKKLNLFIQKGTLPKPDIVIQSSAPLLAFPNARRLALELAVPIVFEVRDLWPLSLVELAGVSRWHPLVLWMSLIERQAYRQSDAVVSLLPNALEHMRPLGLSADRFFYIPNGINLNDWNDPPVPLPDQHKAVFERLKSVGKTVVVYSGAHGPPNALDQVLDLKKVLGDAEVPYHFVMIGDGVSKPELVARARAERCSFIDFLPRVSKPQSLAVLQLADLYYIGWNDKAIYRFGISPNKISEYMYAQKPTVHAVPETNDPVREANAGISVRPFDPHSLNSTLHTLCAMTPEQRDELGRNGRRYVLENLEWTILARKYEDILKRLLGAGKHLMSQ